MENENIRSTFSVYELPTLSASPPSSPLPRRQIKVKFAFSLDGDEKEPETVRLNCEDSDDVIDGCICRSLGDLRWPIEEDVMYRLAEELVWTVRRNASNLRVDIVSVSEGPEGPEEEDREAVVEVSSLKRKRIEEDDEDKEDRCCVICLEGLAVGTEAPMLSCGHFRFHDHCISKWLAKRPSCPLCRHKMMRSDNAES